jgi:hypothetical protein
MRHANMDEYSFVGPCAYSMCMMIELRSAPAQLSRLRTCAAGLAARPTAVRRPPPRCAVVAAFSLRLAALVPDRIFWQFFTISPPSQQI